MRTQIVAVIAIVAFVAGVGLGFILFDAPGVNTPQSIADVQAAPAAEKPAAAEPKARNPESVFAPQTPVGAPEAAPSPATDDSWLATLKKIAAEPQMAPAKVEGVISGVVTDVQGNPVPGVEISLLPQMPSQGVSIPPVTSPDDPALWQLVNDVARNAIRSYGSPWIYRVVGMSGADGRYEIGGLVDTHYNAAARREGYAVKPLGRAGNLRAGERLDWQAWPAQTVEVRVEPPAWLENPIVTVKWEAGPGTGGGASAGRGKPARIAIPPGNCVIWAEDSHNGLRSDKVELTVAPDAPPAPVTLVLHVPPKFIVSIDSSRGGPLGSLQVCYAPWRAELSEADHLDRRRGILVSMNERKGRWQSDELPPGRYVVGVLAGRSLLDSATLALSDAAVEHQFATSAPDAALGITCIVTTPPVSDANKPEFSLWGTRQGSSGIDNWSPETVWVLGPGRYLVTPRHSDDDADVSRTVTALVCRHRAFGVLRREGPFPNGSRVEFAFGQAQRVTLRFRGIPRALERSLTCWVESSVSGSIPAGSGSPHNGQSSVDLGLLQPGTYTATAYGGPRTPTPTLVSKEFIVTPGRDVVVDVELPRLFEVTLQSQPGEVYTWMQISWEGMDPARTDLGSLHMEDDGKCILPCLPPGTYTIKFFLSKSRAVAQEMTFKVTGNMTVNLTG